MPPKRRIAINEVRHAHELTFSIYRRLPVFEDRKSGELFLGALDEARQRLAFDLLAYVVMPEHVHILLAPIGEYNISTILRGLKHSSSIRILRHLEKEQPHLANQLRVVRKDGTGLGRLWQQGGGYDRNIVSANAARASMDYIHANPVKRGLCEFPTDWPWSSALAYAEGEAPVAISTRWFTGEE